MGSQHVTAIKWLAEATDAQVEGLSVGSKTVTFAPRRQPTELRQRNIHISADSGAASTLLILQAILPFLVFAGDESGQPITLEVSGGTNPSFSLSFEYLDQVLLPSLQDRFGIKVDRELKRRGWSMGKQSRGSISLKIFPLGRGDTLKFRPRTFTYPESHQVKAIDATIIVPSASHAALQADIVKDLGILFPDADVHLKPSEESGGDARWYVLLVAHSSDGIRWGKDILCSLPKKTKSRDAFVSNVSSKVCRALYDEVMVAGEADEHLQDQLICFQALCDGFSSFPRGEHPSDSGSMSTKIDGLGNIDAGNGRMRKEKNHKPFGGGSLHAQTARWVASEMLPAVEFYNKGDMVKGVGISFHPSP